MANTDAPNGFQPVRHLHGGTIRYDGGYRIADAYDTNLFQGDFVSLTGTGTNIEDCVAGSGRILGVFAGCQYTAEDGSVVWSNRWIASTATKGDAGAEAFVYTDPGIVYVAQADGTIEAADFGGNFADFVTTHAGNAATGISGMEINAANAGTTTILQLKVIGLAPKLDGITPSEVGANARLYCVVAEGEYTGVLA